MYCLKLQRLLKASNFSSIVRYSGGTYDFLQFLTNYISVTLGKWGLYSVVLSKEDWQERYTIVRLLYDRYKEYFLL